MEPPWLVAGHRASGWSPADGGSGDLASHQHCALPGRYQPGPEVPTRLQGELDVPREARSIPRLEEI